MNVTKSIILVLMCVLTVQVGANEDSNYYENAFLNLQSEYKIAYDKLNAQVEKCSLHKKFDYNYGSIVGKIPKGLIKEQLNAALFLLKKQHNDTCISSEVGVYVSKAWDLRKIIKSAQYKNLKIRSGASFEKILEKISETESMLFSAPSSYFDLLSRYQSISAENRQQLESIEELQSNYNMVNMIEALQKKYIYKVSF